MNRQVILGGRSLFQALPPPVVPSHQVCGRLLFREPLPAGLVRILKLSETQRGQIQAIFDDEWEKSIVQHQKKYELRQQLNQLEHPDSCQERAMRSAAVELAAMEADSLATPARTHDRISAVLTADQLSLAQSYDPLQDAAANYSSCLALLTE